MSDEIKEVDCTPDTALLVAQANQNSLDWQSALCEFIDNSIDAGSTVIDITIGPKKAPVVIRDNGVGCADLTKFFTFGGRSSNGPKTIGRYGVGSKDAALWLCGDKGKVRVDSAHGDKIRSMTGDFGHMVSTKRWAIRAEDQSVDSRVNEPTGTKITISPLTRNHPPIGFSTLIDSLGYYYSPAIKNHGVNITVKVKGESYLVEPYKWPTFETETRIDRTIDINGKTARVVFGIVQDPPKNTRPGITYSHASRVIIPASSKGCKGYSIGSVCGFVELGAGWPLDKNKQGVARDSEELFEAVFQAIQGVLAVAQSRFEKTESARIIREAQDRMNQALGFTEEPNAKAVREKGGKHGTKYGTGRGHKHKQAGKEQPGKTFCSGRRSVQFDVVRFDESRRHMVGYCEPGGKVLLNAQHEAVIEAQKSVDGLLAIVAPIYAEAAANEEPDGQKRLRGINRLSERKTFSEIFGEILNMIRVPNHAA